MILESSHVHLMIVVVVTAAAAGQLRRGSSSYSRVSSSFASSESSPVLSTSSYLTYEGQRWDPQKTPSTASIPYTRKPTTNAPSSPAALFLSSTSPDTSSLMYDREPPAEAPAPQPTPTSARPKLLNRLSTPSPGGVAIKFPGESGFSCTNRLPGYYADPSEDCTKWHWCVSGGRHYSFNCPEQTRFNQALLVCDWWYNVDCSRAVEFYRVNADLYVTS